MLCGDSFTFGWGVSTNDTCASALDKLIDEHSDHRARVVNLGCARLNERRELLQSVLYELQLPYKDSTA